MPTHGTPTDQKPTSVTVEIVSGASRTFGTSVFGASFVTRTVMTLVLRALQLVGRGAIAGEFFKTEAEARAWITARRKQVAAAQ